MREEFPGTRLGLPHPIQPDEMGIGPVFAVPKRLARNGLTIDDIGLRELNEAYAVQAIYCRDKLGIPMERLNFNGSTMSIAHPFGMTGSRIVVRALLEGRRRSSAPCPSAAAWAPRACSTPPE